MEKKSKFHSIGANNFVMLTTRLGVNSEYEVAGVSVFEKESAQYIDG